MQISLVFLQERLGKPVTGALRIHNAKIGRMVPAETQFRLDRLENRAQEAWLIHLVFLAERLWKELCHSRLTSNPSRMIPVARLH